MNDDDAGEGLALNRRWWEERAPLHVSGDFYDIDRFLDGTNTLLPWETEELPDVSGRSLVHLQCHFGLDTLSWARLGAQVTGLDFSKNATAAACDIADRAGIDARFVAADVYDAISALGATYDIVYTGHGALNWLPDLDRWASIVSELLNPGGELYLAEFHPGIDVMSLTELEVDTDFFDLAAGLRFDDAAGSYATAKTDTANNSVMEWTHGLGRVVTALASTELRIERLVEHDAIAYPRFPFLERGADGAYRMPAGKPRIPLSYSLKARKPGDSGR